MNGNLRRINVDLPKWRRNRTNELPNQRQWRKVYSTNTILHFNNTSQAKETIQVEGSKEQPLIKSRDGKMYPKNLFNEYIM